MNKINLRYTCLGGDLLIYKNLNDCMTISRGITSIPFIKYIESMGERIQDITHPDNPFTKEEMQYGIDIYNKTDAGKRWFI